MAENLTEMFVNNLFDLKNNKIPESARIKAKKCLLDYIGVTLAGSIMSRNKVQNLINYLCSEDDFSTIIGYNIKNNVVNAAFLNGLNSHFAELDDGVRFGGIHPGAPIFSALLPFIENEKTNEANIIKSIIIGYEAAISIANSIQPSHYNKGYHATGTCGVIGAVVAIGIFLDFSKEEMKNAISAAANIASGTLKVIEDNSDLKPFNVANAAKSAVLSAYMSKAGFCGPEDIFSGNSGFLRIMTDDINISYLRRNEIDEFGIEKVYFKPYASCRHCHAPIEASLNLISKHKFKIDDIKKIKVFTYNYIINKHDHTGITGTYSAKMSIPYSVAVALFSGKAGINEFESNFVKNNKILALADKVKVYEDENISILVPKKRPAVIEIITNDGSSYKERVDFPKGEPENPLSDIELTDKFITLAKYGGKTKKEAEKIIEYVYNIENDLNKLFDLL